MDYQKVYNALIQRGQTRVLYGEMIESHHIIPRSEGGSNKKSNKVELTPKEHHLCHLCLLRLGLCLKYCYRHLTLRDYIKIKTKEKHKVRNNLHKIVKEWSFQKDYENSLEFVI